MSIQDQLEEERRIINAATGCKLARYSADFRDQRSHSLKAPSGAVRAFTGYGPDEGGAYCDAERLAHSWNALPLRNAQVEAASGLVGELNQAAEESRSSSYGQIDATWARMQGAAFAYEDAARRIRRAIEEAQ